MTPVSARPMINCWICVVPSGIDMMIASRASFSTKNSVVTPLPPWIWTAWRATFTAISVAKYFAIAASISAGTPASIIDAARSLGYGRWARFWRIEAPIATRICLPGLTNILTNLFKTTSQASVITVPELMYYAGQIYNDTFRTLEVMILVLLIYVVLVSILTFAMARLEAFMAFPGYGRVH